MVRAAEGRHARLGPIPDPRSRDVRSLVHAGLLAAAEEMGGVLKRSSYSPIIRDMEDFSCAIFKADGDLVAQADFYPRAARRDVARREGDPGAVGQGDPRRGRLPREPPHLGAMHTPDLNVIAPMFVNGRLFAWTGTTAHHLDVGGVNPGTEGPALEQVYAEGILLAPVRLYRAGEENPDVFAILTENIRDPLSTISDLRAQRAACLLGRRRLEEAIARRGGPVIEVGFRQALDSAERATRLGLADLPDGEGEAEGFMDDDGRDGPPTRIHVRLAKRGDHLTIDLSGSAPQVGGALNVPWASTRASVVYGIRAVGRPHMASNDGVLRAVEIVCPFGNAEPTAAGGGLGPSQHLPATGRYVLPGGVGDLAREGGGGSSVASLRHQHRKHVPHHRPPLGVVGRRRRGHRSASCGRRHRRRRHLLV